MRFSSPSCYLSSLIIHPNYTVLKHEDILEELKVDLVEKKSAHYKQK
jgi:hypothetical protein